MIPKGIEAKVCHLEYAADVGGLSLIEEKIGGGRIEILMVSPLQESQRHKRIEEITRRARMEPQPTP